MKKIATAVVLTLTLSPLSGCWGGDEPAGTTQRATTKSSETPKPTPPPQSVAIEGVPQGLVTAIEKFYNNKDLGTALDPKIAPQVAERQHPTAAIKGVGSTGNWKGRPIAVVASGQDVTLAVENNGWIIVGGWWPSLGVDKPALGGVRRVLAIGGDAREDGARDAHALLAGTVVNRSHADSLHIIGFDGRGGAGMLGIPRDSYAQLSTGGPRQKINGAMRVGGPSGQLKTVEEFTGVQLDGYFLTGFKGFRLMIDWFGPLKHSVKKHVQIFDRRSPGDIPAGNLELNGQQTLDLARARKRVGGGDSGRSHQQGRIMLSAAAMAKAAGPMALPQILTKSSPWLETDLSARGVLTFLAYTYTLRPKLVPNRVAPGAEAVVDRRYVVMIDDRGRQLFEDMKDGNLAP